MSHDIENFTFVPCVHIFSFCQLYQFSYHNFMYVGFIYCGSIKNQFSILFIICHEQTPKINKQKIK